ncbi:MAG: hypothetical protein JWL70_2562 [Acidimicrobiia bacterium]|nr:hypothetical protein [Acidimicrobiia bacterium]
MRWRMGIIELHEDTDGYLVCPNRGQISAQWCVGCDRRLRVSYEGERTVVMCDPGPPESEHSRSPGPLRDVPDSFRIY